MEGIFRRCKGQNWGNQKQHSLTTQQFIDTNTAKQKEPAQNITLWAGFLVRVVIQHFSKNTVISMVLGHPNSEITCIPPS